MPKVVEVDGYRVMVYTLDHSPAHVHVLKNGVDVRVLIGDVAQLWDVHRGQPSVKEVRRAVEIVGENLEACNEAWRRIHG